MWKTYLYESIFSLYTLFVSFQFSDCGGCSLETRERVTVDDACGPIVSQIVKGRCCKGFHLIGGKCRKGKCSVYTTKSMVIYSNIFAMDYHHPVRQSQIILLALVVGRILGLNERAA